MIEYAAFLRGINLGRRRIKMEDLRASFTGMGFSGVRTLIASGNVVFSAEDKDGLVERIEAALGKDFGFAVPTVLREMDRLQALVDSKPFGSRVFDNDMRGYIYMLAKPEARNLKLPCALAGDFEVVKLTEDDILTIAYRKPDGRYSEEMEKAVGRPFRDRITNRNWNTIERLVAGEARG